LSPRELENLCTETKGAWLALGSAGYEKKPSEESSVKFRRSIYVVKDINAGESVTEENIRRIRPGYGLSPKHYKELIGRRVSCDLKRGTALKWEHII
jgi:N-acetylneuraminate synthase